MFDSEKKLVDLLKSKLKRTKLPFEQNEKRRRKVILDEVDLGYGIADLVVTHTHSRGSTRCTYDAKEIRLLTCIHEHDILNVNTLVDRTGIQMTILKKSLKRLESENYIRVNGNSIRPLKSYRCTIHETIAIEAKLKNWSRALKQAYRYKWFSNIAVVCIPEAYAAPAKRNISEFKKLDVGLMTLNEKGEMKAVFIPSSSPPINPEMHMLLNERVVTSIGAT